MIRTRPVWLCTAALAACGSLPPLPPDVARPRQDEAGSVRVPQDLDTPIAGTVVPAIDRERLPIDLEFCLRLAGSSAPELERVRARLAVVRAHADWSWWRLWPSLGLGASARGEDGRILSSTGEVPDDRNFVGASLGVVLHYALNPMQAIYDRAASLCAVEAATAATEVERQREMRRAAMAYGSLQEAWALASLADEAAQFATARLGLLQARGAAGIIAPAELADVELSLARRRREHQTASATARQRSIELASILRLDPRVLLEPASSLRALALVNPELSIEDLQARAIERRQERVAVERSLAGLEESTSAARWGAFAPSVALSFFVGGVGRVGGTSSLAGPEGLGGRTTYGLGITETLSGDTYGRIGVVAATATGAAVGRELLEQAMLAEVVAARSATLDAKRGCELAAAEVRAASSAALSAEQRRANGLTNGVEHLVRSEDLVASRQRAVSALVQWNRSQVDLLFAVGSLGPALQ